MTLEELYLQHCKSGTAIAAHLPRLRALAEGLDVAVEFGVKGGASSTALLLAAKHVLSYDIKETPAAVALNKLEPRWRYYIEDSRKIVIPPCDLLFLDSHHSYAQVQDELAAHAHCVRRYLIFHDTITFSSVAADGETGRQVWTYVAGQSVPREHLGIRPAIDHYMAQDDSWRIKHHYTDSHGLLVLERR